MNSGPDHKSNWSHIWMLGIKGLLSWEYQMKFTEIEKDKMSRMWVGTWYCQVSQVTQEWLLFSKQHFGNLEITKSGHMMAQHFLFAPLPSLRMPAVAAECTVTAVWLQLEGEAQPPVSKGQLATPWGPRSSLKFSPWISLKLFTFSQLIVVLSLGIHFAWGSSKKCELVTFHLRA